MDTLSGRQLRDRAGLSWARLRDYRVAGVIPEPDAAGRWPPGALDALLRARRLEQEEGVRMLPRRVVRLACEGYPVAGDKLRAAMVAVAPTIPRPVRTLARVRRARLLLAHPDLAGLPDRRRERRERELLGPAPPPDRWVDILNRADPDGLARRVWVWHLAGRWARERTRETPFDVGDIPFEEVVTLFAVEDIGAELDRHGNGGSAMEQARVQGQQGNPRDRR